ncbi:CpsD/CapB family tyrosine-protein kinase [Paenibacillus methanolicus]|uniref:non-specific protein-tyrosine kinase n=1 Tax=Paenibacillus methanolicus TaxID=582686 RepID=A0A5S5BVS0_9BACL|nr:CpsD/CapB family tyrosine-protein kinase [Paenibacillus methanolicus]TYP70282.1 capsular exopolysaccharide synthesis family protein [Paenibacillus methanolicus]
MSRQITNQVNTLTYHSPASPIAEEYRTLRTNIGFSAASGDRICTIVVTSGSAEEGKTATVTNLAITFAQEGKRVLLVDADLRKPVLHNILRSAKSAGLTNVLRGQAKWQEVVQDTEVQNLSFLAAGTHLNNPLELLNSNSMWNLLEELKANFEVILFDSSPCLSVSEPVILASICDGVVIVTQAGKTKKDAFAKVNNKLERARATVLGVVLNNVKDNKREAL